MGEIQSGEEGHEGTGIGWKAQGPEKCGVEKSNFACGQSEVGQGKSGRQINAVKVRFSTKAQCSSWRLRLLLLDDDKTIRLLLSNKRPEKLSVDAGRVAVDLYPIGGKISVRSTNYG